MKKTIASAHAHCDVPCGVYEPDSMKWAVETCDKLVTKILALAPVDPAKDKEHYFEFHNTLARAIATKEEYAQICKDQILILWTDYFKPEHLTKWPDLHDKVWKATKQCSIVKRTISTAEVAKLRAMVDEIAAIFAETKK
ncbi:MAG: superoxide dismutase, Ni [Patescibacteria group bacterium]